MKVAAIVGPTAVGKSAVAVAAAERLDAEIVSLDSMQVYRGMDIGTDKPSVEMRGAVPHHMLDLLDPQEDLTVAEFQERARAAVSEIAARSRLPLLVGGSGLYFRAVVDDLRFPPRSAEVRRELEAAVDVEGAEALHARLRELDPVAADKIKPGNVRRTVRALEVIELTGRPFSYNTSWEDYRSVYELGAVGLSRPRPELFERIAQRVESMLEGGLVEEARELATQGMSRTARQALGYRQILDAQPGAPHEALAAAIVSATKRFARRQDAWFRADPRIEWLEANRSGLADRVVEAISR